VTDLVKIGIIAAVLLALVVAGVALRPASTASTTAATAAPVATPTVTKETVVLPPVSMEMLDPIYSEKAVFEDDTVRLSFKASQTKDGVESRILFWLHNVSRDVVTVVWDRCSIQLPSGNTVNVTTDDQLNATYYVPSSTPLSVAPGGDLFSTLIPVSEVKWTDCSSATDSCTTTYSTTTGILDQAPFLLVFAIEKGSDCGPRTIQHYAFRLVIR